MIANFKTEDNTEENTKAKTKHKEKILKKLRLMDELFHFVYEVSFFQIQIKNPGYTLKEIHQMTMKKIYHSKGWQ